jgi:hypothetical protein
MFTPVVYPGLSSGFSGTRKVLDNAAQFEIDLIIISEKMDQQVIYLKEVDRSRLVPVLIGIFEATMLDRTLKGLSTPRPLTHDAFAASIRLLGGEVQDVIIDRLENHVYYASARIRNQGGLLPLDVRPSDAFVLALLFDCPIFIADPVLDQIDRQGNIK